MKVPSDDYACLNLDAPVLPAYETTNSNSVRRLVWCDRCDVFIRDQEEIQRCKGETDQQELDFE
jgi:hypothetical protein